MSLLNQSSNFVITGGEFTAVNNINGSAGLRELYKSVARGATHDSKVQYEAPKCHKDTRTRLLSDIHNWTELLEKGTGIMFLHGPAGSGKSCIARSVCERTVKEGILGASFFFWRSAADRNTTHKLFTTIAYQLASMSNELGERILAAIDRNPQYADIPLEVQFRTLIYEPCMSIPREKLYAKVIVIDGLDECVDPNDQILILELLARAVRYDDFPLGFFITSRPELHLQEVFDTKEVIFAMHLISLSRIPGISQDIRTVLESGFSRILNNPRFRTALKSVPRPWPSTDILNKLVKRSSGQFIYAATVLKFVNSSDHNPASQLKIVLSIRDSNNTSALADLDLLYREILYRVPDLERTRKVLGCILALKSMGRMDHKDDIATTISKAIVRNQHILLQVVDQLLSLPVGESYLSLNQLHSLVSLNVGSQSLRRTLEIQFHHKSFQDFLTRKRRSKDFYIDMKTTHFELYECCLKVISCPKYDTEEQHVGWIYARFLWDKHLSKSNHYIRRELFYSGLKACIGLQRYLDYEKLKHAIHLLGLKDSICVDGDVPQNQMLATNSLWREHLRQVFGRWGELNKNPYGHNNLADFEESIIFPTWRNCLEPHMHNSFTKKILTLYDILEGRDHSSGWVSRLLVDGDEEQLIKHITSVYDDISSIFCKHPDIARRFISDSRYSGPFHCTTDDYEAAFLLILGEWKPESVSPSASFVEAWMTAFASINPSLTPNLCASLISAATYYHDDETWNKEFHIVPWIMHLLMWLKGLPTPPQDIIDAWGKTHQQLFILKKDRCVDGDTHQRQVLPQVSQRLREIRNDLLYCDVTDFQELLLFPIWLLCLKPYMHGTLKLTKKVLVLYLIFGDNSEVFKEWAHHFLKNEDQRMQRTQMISRYDDIDTIFCQELYSARMFLSSSQYSGPFHCTQDDYEAAFIFVIGGMSSFYWHSTFASVWMNALARMNPPLTPKLRTSLMSAAMCYGGDALSQPWRMVRFFDWLKGLSTSTQDVVEAWEKVISKVYPESLEAHKLSAPNKFK